MIGKGKSISHTRASMPYGWNQEKDADIVLKEFLHGDSPTEITQEFKMLQDQTTIVKRILCPLLSVLQLKMAKV